MRMIVALIAVSISFSLSGCSRPPQAGHSKLAKSKWELPQSQRHVPKFTEARSAKPSTEVSPPISKRSKKSKTHLAKPTRPHIEVPASSDTGPPLPARNPELTHIKSPAADAESSPPLPPRKPDQTPMTPNDSHGHAIEPDGKFLAAKEKAKREGVHTLTSEDVRGLSQEQIKELRGY
jgi:hypothetical protein